MAARDGISSYELADGSTRWKVRYRNPDREQRIQWGLPTRKAAERWKAGNVTIAIAQGAYIDPQATKRVTVGDIAELWLAGRRVEATSNARTLSILRTHIEPRWYAWPVSTVNTAEVQRWVAEMSDTMAPATVRKNAQTLAMIMRTAENAGKITRNPCDKVKLPEIDRNPDNKGRALTTEQLRAVLDHHLVRGHADRTGIVLVLASCGLRFSEMAGLRRRNIDLEARLLRIEQTVVQVDGVGQVWKDYPKNGDRRLNDLPGFVVDPLRFALAGKAPDDIAFSGELSGAPLWRQSTMRSWLAKALTDAGAPADFNWHDFRHTHISLAQAFGADRAELAESVGHGSMEILDRYTHKVGRAGGSVADAMDRAFSV